MQGEFSHGFKTYEEALTLAENFPPSQKIATVYQKLGYNMYLQGWGEDGLRYVLYIQATVLSFYRSLEVVVMLHILLERLKREKN